MTPRNNQEIKGTLESRSLAELLAEIAEAQFDGSLRVSHQNHKVIIYFAGGAVVFAASNARSARLFDILLREHKIDQFVLKANPNFVNDMEFAKSLVEQNLFTQEAMNAIFAHQIELILRQALMWKTGEWHFSHLVRIKENIHYNVNVRKLLFDYGRILSEHSTLDRFSDDEEETFSLAPPFSNNFSPNPMEAFVLSRFANSELTLSELKAISGLSESQTLHILYVLWLGGFLIRKDWDSLFSKELVELIRGAKVELKKQVVKPVLPKPVQTQEIIAEKIVEEEPEEIEEEITIEQYLKQVEDSLTYYEILDVDSKCALPDIKAAYFNYAKRFHPDRFHKESDGKLLQRIQDAFAKLAQVYDTLKNRDSRESYDFKMHKEIAKREEMKVAGLTDEQLNAEEQKDLATDSFDKGFDLLMEEQYEEAMPYLARAAHLSPNIARYRAYYGKILSYIEKQRHKAEQELQTAIKLEPNNMTFRIMLVEFFIQYNLYKRAEGELNRLLAIEPDNKEAQILLNDLPKK